MNKQNRNYMRITTRRKAYVRFLPSAETKPMYSGCASCYSQSNAQSLQGTQLPKDLLNFLKDMDAKLNMIISLQNQEYMQQQFDFECDITEISGAGLQFSSNKEIETGQAVEMAVVISQIPFKIVGLVGIIQRIESTDPEFLYVVEYTSIRDDDREAIVQFVFHEQREQIRERQNA